MTFRIAFLPVALLALAATSSATMIDAFDGSMALIMYQSDSVTKTGSQFFGAKRTVGLSMPDASFERPWTAFEANGAMTITAGYSPSFQPFLVLGYGSYNSVAGQAVTLGPGHSKVRLTFGEGTSNVTVNAFQESWDSSYDNYDFASANGSISGAGVLDLDFGANTLANFGYLTVTLNLAPDSSARLLSIESVPEPASMAVLGLGLAGLKRRRAKRN